MKFTLCEIISLWKHWNVKMGDVIPFAFVHRMLVGEGHNFHIVIQCRYRIEEKKKYPSHKPVVDNRNHVPIYLLILHKSTKLQGNTSKRTSRQKFSIMQTYAVYNQLGANEVYNVREGGSFASYWPICENIGFDDIFENCVLDMCRQALDRIYRHRLAPY